jgi:hypothetical protein
VVVMVVMMMAMMLAMMVMAGHYHWFGADHYQY